MRRLSIRKRGTRDRRRTLRIGFDCPLRWNDGGADRAGWTRDLSDNGIGFVTRALSAPKAGQQIQVVLELDDENEWLVDRSAKVVRSEPKGRDMYAVGLQLQSAVD